MTRDEIERLIMAGEGLTIEFKASFPKNATDFAHDIAAFSNTEGGTILVGVDDQGKTLGVPNPDETMQRIVGVANSICKPALRPDMGKTSLEHGQQVVWVTIPKNRESLTLVSGKRYVRNGPVAIPVEDSSELQKLVPRKANRLYRPSIFLFMIGLALAGILAALFVSRHFANGHDNSAARVTEARKAYNLAIAYEAQGDDEQAIVTLKDATESDPAFGEAYLRAAYISQQDDQYDRATEFLRQAEHSPQIQDPNFARQVKAMSSHLQGDDETAIEEFKLLADMTPANPYVLYYYGDVALEMGRFDEAEAALEKCLASTPLDALCNFDTMMLRVSRNRFDDTLRIYDDLTKKSLNYPWFDIPVGLALLGKDDVAGAGQKLSHFAESNKKFHGSVLFTTAQEYKIDWLTYQGRIAEARSLASKLSALEEPGDRASPLLDMAMVDDILGDAKNTEAELKVAKEISSGDSDSRKAEKLLAIIEVNRKIAGVTLAGSKPSQRESSLGPLDSKFAAAMNDLKNGGFNEAIRGLKLISEKDDDPFYVFFLGRAYLMTGDWQKAIELLKNVQEAKGRVLTQSDLPVVAWPLTFYYDGLCNEALGRVAEAVSSYQKFLDIWRAADPGMPKILDARKRLNRLSTLKPSAH